MSTDMLHHLGYMSNVHVDKQLSILVYIDHQPITMRDWYEGDITIVRNDLYCDVIGMGWSSQIDMHV